MNELKKQQEAEAAEREYVIATAEAQASGLRLRTDERTKSIMAGRPSSGSILPDPAKDSATKSPAVVQDNIGSTAQEVKTSSFVGVASDTHKHVGFAENAPLEDAVVPVLMLPDEHSVGTGGGMAEGNPDMTDGSEEFLVSQVVASEEITPVAGGSVVPILMLPDEQHVGTGGDITEGNLDISDGNGEFAAEAAGPPTERNVGQSQNNASTTIVSTGTQTSPRDEAEQELHASSSEGSFDDSVISL